MNSSSSLKNLLQAVPVQPVLPRELLQSVTVLDLSARNPRLAGLNLADTDAFCRFIEQEIAAAGALVGVGGYSEERVIYGSPVFTSAEEVRTVHLGVDLWAPAGTPVFAPLPARVHSFADNHAYRDYGPTIILEHELQGQRFYTLYGHLNKTSLQNLHQGMEVAAGQQIAVIGAPHENVQWPPHLHFQIITDLKGREGDFYGVAPKSERQAYLANCPDPNLLLRLKALEPV